MSRNPSPVEEAIMLWNSGQREQARLMLEAAVSSQPRDERAWLWLARASTDPSRQKQALLRVLEINPQNDIARRVLAERFPGEVQRQSQVIDLLGEAAFAEDWSRAEHLYSQVLRLDPANADALDALLDHYAGSRQWSKGFTLLNYCRNKLPDHPDLIRRQVEFSLRSGDLEALRMLDQILLNHRAVTVEHLLKAGELFAKASQYPIVAMLLERATQLDPRNQTVLYGLAKAYDVTGRAAQAKAVRQRIADVDHKSKLGQSMISYLLEQDPYVPLSMRENTLVAVREAVGVALPLLLLALLDHKLNLFGLDQLLALLLAFGGGYLLVTATSSHEQKLWKTLLASEVTEPLRYIFGAVGSLLVMIALYFALHTSAAQADNMAQWKSDACVQLVSLIFEDAPEAQYPPDGACDWLRDYFYEELYAPD